jgi:hypothetical protein
MELNLHVLFRMPEVLVLGLMKTKRMTVIHDSYISHLIS